MYEKEQLQPKIQPEHLEIASKMATEINQRFPPYERVESVKFILDDVKRHLICELEESKSRLEHLEKCYNSMPNV